VSCPNISLHSLKKLIVLSLFFHFLLAFHRQFVLLFVSEEFFKRTTRIGQDLKNCFDRSCSKTKGRPASNVQWGGRSSQLETPLGNVMQTYMSPFWMSGAAGTSHAAGFSDLSGRTTRCGNSAVSQLDLNHLLQSSSTTIPQPTCTYAPA
jgi:hypothetical protein